MLMLLRLKMAETGHKYESWDKVPSKERPCMQTIWFINFISTGNDARKGTFCDINHWSKQIKNLLMKF